MERQPAVLQFPKREVRDEDMEGRCKSAHLATNFERLRSEANRNLTGNWTLVQLRALSLSGTLACRRVKRAGLRVFCLRPGGLPSSYWFLPLTTGRVCPMPDQDRTQESNAESLLQEVDRLMCELQQRTEVARQFDEFFCALWEATKGKKPAEERELFRRIAQEVEGNRRPRSYKGSPGTCNEETERRRGTMSTSALRAALYARVYPQPYL
jgi:hypothetical protein